MVGPMTINRIANNAGFKPQRLATLAGRALEWQTWTRREMFARLFEKYQPVLATRFPSLQFGSAVRAVLAAVTARALRE